MIFLEKNNRMELLWVNLVLNDSELNHIPSALLKILKINGFMTENQIINMTNAEIRALRASSDHIKHLYHPIE